MSSGNQFKRLFKLWATVAKLVVDGKRNMAKVADVLQSIVDVQQSTFQLYLAPGQENGGTIRGYDLEKYLKEGGLMDRAFSLEDELVKGWIADPSTYPEELKGKAVFLWKSKRSSGDSTIVAYLCWNDGCVVVGWDWFGDWWHGRRPALLAPPEAAGRASS
ncbi:MAG: hypothetical protein Q7R89_01545 [bacterium]|nr:hypothetical protein [bacterium]